MFVLLCLFVCLRSDPRSLRSLALCPRFTRTLNGFCALCLFVFARTLARIAREFIPLARFLRSHYESLHSDPRSVSALARSSSLRSDPRGVWSFLVYSPRSVSALARSSSLRSDPRGVWSFISLVYSPQRCASLFPSPILEGPIAVVSSALQSRHHPEAARGPRWTGGQAPQGRPPGRNLLARP